MEEIKFSYENALSDNIGDHGIPSKAIKKFKAEATKTHEKLFQTRSRGEIGFFDLPFNDEVITSLTDHAKRVQSKYENLLVLGIGGSALGMRCLKQALLPPYYNSLPARGRGGCPKIYVHDNIDPDGFEPLLDLLDWRQTSVCVISKSGRTTETISQFFMVRDILIKKFGSERWKEKIFIITDPQTGPLRRMVNEEGIASFPVPVNVGGRFSVLSPVGLFPAACAGISIRELLSGAADMLTRCSDPDMDNNPSLMGAVINYLFDKDKDVNISVMMPYADGLEKFSDWYAQLLAESLGKDQKGLTPVKALGVTDQHSQLQLYMDGRYDKLITMLSVESISGNRELPVSMPEPFEYLSGHKLGTILRAEMNATKRALKEAGRPQINISVPKLDAYNLGSLFMFYMIQIAYMGMLYKVNPFNQPGVELGKKITKSILSEKSH